jgi:hypothetical protein
MMTSHVIEKRKYNVNYLMQPSEECKLKATESCKLN